jgi:hypothetical protein
MAAGIAAGCRPVDLPIREMGSVAVMKAAGSGAEGFTVSGDGRVRKSESPDHDQDNQTEKYFFHLQS